MAINPRKIEFFNRESETAEIKNILESEPRLITFIYGPINSGKTSLIQKLIDDLPKDKYAVFYINLRGKLIKEYSGFVRVLFKVKRKEISEKLTEKGEKLAKKALVLAGRYLSGIPIEKDILDGFLDAKSTEDVFEFLEEYFLKISETKIPILIIDELQVIGDLEINGKAIYKLFNFFIRLTKELHVCHVFTLSSDSLFIEKVYSEAMLQGRARYLLVDDFDEATAKRFLKKYKFSDEEITLSLKYVGGKPGYLIEAVEAKVVGKNIKEAISNILNTRKGEIKTTLNRVKQLGAHVIIVDDTHKIDYNLLNGTLNKFGERPYINTMEADEITKTYLAKQNILFVDPVFNIIKPQSKIDLLAIREILG
ncbi:conserved hypothetical protein [groundwater metagenome]|uniref:AAA+ ATPase domain-containing protein n=1 Tax=groundwater metagenome TaxID=717931 RepID=A0A098E7K2_9ZZZZ